MKYEIDYEKLFALVKEKKWALSKVSYECERGQSWLSVARTQNAKMTEPICKILASVLGCEMDDFLLKKEEPLKKPTELDDIRDELLSLSEKVERLLDITITQQADIIAILLGNDQLSSAVAILNALLCGNGKCKESVYRNACARRKIPEDIMKKALESAGAHYVMYGSGQNGIRWIVR